MLTTRERALDAAVELIGTQGLRALTHARVDEQAGIPRGSTSNYFRTRAALLEGVVTRVADQELGNLAPAVGPDSMTPNDLVEAITAVIEVTTGEFRSRTIARYVLFLESAHDIAVQAPLVANRQRFERWTEDMLTHLGAADPVSATRALMACGEGLVLHRITVDPDADPRPAVAMVVRGCLEPAAIRAVP
ncbi:MAG: hypothetical protein QOI70_311 [Microbacteriaceae bacterium]|jgi:DNA-binding transcriptional regulator YbjK|nr:hypothetical protein [Microbacteriaceae bacterium]